MIEEQKPLEIPTDSREPSFDSTDRVISNQEAYQEPFQGSADSASQTATTADGVTSESRSTATSNQPEATFSEQAIANLQQEMQSLKQQLEEQTQQNETLKKQYISIAADFDNYRKRTLREKEELEDKVKCKTLIELLAVVDNFERARTQIKPGNDGEMAIHKSYQGVYKNLVDSLKRLGVSAMRPEGQPFDPIYHEAMLTEYTDEYPEGTVIEQLVRGYLLGDRVLRHAMVKVAAAKDPDRPSTTANPSVEMSGETELSS